VRRQASNFKHIICLTIIILGYVLVCVELPATFLRTIR